MVDTARLLSTVRARGPALAADVGVNFVLPFVIYSYGSPRIGDVQALLASSLLNRAGIAGGVGL